MTRPNITKERDKYLKKHKIEQKRRIIEKGREICLQEGVEKFSIHRVAKETGMTPGNIYTYFKGGKRELWVHMFNQHSDIDVIQPFLDNFQDSSTSFVQKLENSFRLFFDLAEKDYNRYKIIWDTPLPDPPTKKHSGEPIISEKEKETEPVVLNTFIKATINAIQMKEIPDSNPLLFALLVFSLISGTIKTSNLLKSIDSESLKLFGLKTEQIDKVYYGFTEKEFIKYYKSYLKEKNKNK
ncbi:MAG: TetR/AcrR family transcriptional regulator [Candidatus Hodarchaeales archaeon]|jgi:AcrR family transcriptional regulator